MFSSFVSGAAVGLLMMLVGSAGMKTKLAFGPFLIFGAIITLVWGQYLLSFFI
jgi:leader peptidase (prepilin peptidase)/N-methyltransferase